MLRFIVPVMVALTGSALAAPATTPGPTAEPTSSNPAPPNPPAAGTKSEAPTPAAPPARTPPEIMAAPK